MTVPAHHPVRVRQAQEITFQLAIETISTLLVWVMAGRATDGSPVGMPRVIIEDRHLDCALATQRLAYGL